GRPVLIEANDGRADEVKRPVGGSLRPSARHPREQAKSCFPAGIFIENRGSPRSSASLRNPADPPAGPIFGGPEVGGDSLIYAVCNRSCSLRQGLLRHNYMFLMNKSQK
ncbi:hypothetical protein ACFSHQ_02400, partial [Gemmobacter lanyuensis]